MSEPFIVNHQYNFIKKQAGILEQTLRANADSKILESVRYSAELKIAELFPNGTNFQKHMLEAIFNLQSSDDFAKHLMELESYLIEFPQITDKQIQKLFPKNKKLKLPDLGAIDYRYVTYISWIDISTNKLFIVYHMNGQFIGIEGRYTPTNKKGYCFVCNRHEELALFTAISKKRPANSSPDYYRAIGNYLCIHGHECNKNITDPSLLEKFVDSVIG
ncbi:FusB/FusC family EF-G-binding protein [Paenibacillus herberti]|uniref:Elongation factor G-binding protein n=1 Tax=Paenibacillus herberti TaxID=1619309 RepID=A0A229P503_9BACL|nr:FusB/FusC family EF-G-binding protein [Paenibacillus herberti]OXM17366.1 elongation factor G-binding protein [Paenibacillus herberti]